MVFNKHVKNCKTDVKVTFNMFRTNTNQTKMTWFPFPSKDLMYTTDSLRSMFAMKSNSISLYNPLLVKNTTGSPGVH